MTATYTVYAPSIPGQDPSRQGEYPTLNEARQATQRFQRRPDLKRQDVVIYRGSKRVEFAGPCR